jgi:hypothetical protein
MYGIGRSVAIHNFLTSCELANILLHRDMTPIGTLRKHQPEIPLLFLSGKQSQVYSSIFGFTSDLTLVLYVPARDKPVILLLSQHHEGTCLDEERDCNQEIIIQTDATKNEFDVLDKLVRGCTRTRSTRNWRLKVFLSYIDVACVNEFVLWMLKYPNWQQKNHRRINKQLHPHQ